MRLGFHVVYLCVVTCFIGALTTGCDYARMRNDEAIEFYELELPQMPPGILPLGIGTDLLSLDPQRIQNPLAASPNVIARGKAAYGYYCVHCHGTEGDGRGTVGQSFAPLPTNLTGPGVQSQSDSELYEKITQGFLRHPPLAYTVAAEDRWKIILFMRRLANPG